MKKQLQLLFLILIVSIQTNAQTGAALSFSGASDYVQINDPNFGTSNFTIETWMKPNTATGAYLITNRSVEMGGAGNWFVVHYTNNGAIGLELADAGMGSAYFATPNNVITVGAWNHIAVVRSGLKIYIYVNGVTQATLVEPGMRNLNTGQNSLRLSGWANVGVAFFNGTMDETRLWNVARTECELNIYKGCEIPTTATGLVGNYHFNQGINGSNNTGVNMLTDNSASSNNGTLANFNLSGTTSNWVAPGAVVSGYTTLSVCPTASALNFDGVNDYVMTSSNITHGNNFTYEAWIKPMSANAWGGIMTTSSLGGESQWVQVTLNNSGALRAEIVDDAGNNKWYEGNTSLLGAWHHIAVSFDGTNLLFYIDGNVESTSALNNGTLGNMTINSQLNIGSERNHSAFYHGDMDEVRVWNVARTRCEINSYKNCEIPSNAVGLVANYHFNQGFPSDLNTTVTTLTDVSGNAFTGTLNNFALNGTTSNWIAPGGVVSGYTTALAPPTVGAIVTNSVICSGNTTTLNGNGATTYTWTNGVTDAIAFSPTTTTTYTVTGTLASTGCTNTATKSVTVNATPTVSVNSGTICSGNSFTMVPSGASTYTYSSGSAVVSPTANTSYSVTGTSALGCVSSNTAVSIVNQTISNQLVTATPTAICAGSSAVINVQSTEIGVTYTLRNNANNTILAGPTAGTGSLVAFNTGTLSTTTTYNVYASKVVNAAALDFKGNGRVTITGLNISPSVVPVFTAEAWINLTSNTGLQTIVGNDNGGYDRGMVVWNGEYHIFAGRDINTGIVPNTNVWEHIAISWSASNITMYVNGVNVYSTSGETIDPGPTDTYISGTYAVSGIIDEVRLWNTTRSLSQISSNMNSCLLGNESGLMAYYNFNDGTGSSTLSDLTSNGYNGTLSNMNVNTDWVAGTAVCGNTMCTLQMLDTPTVTVNALPTVTVNSGAICAGQSFTMSPSGAVTYSYSNGSDVAIPTADATYTVTGTDANGCENMATSSVTVNALPTVTVNSGAICAGQSFTMSPSGAVTYSYSNGSDVAMPTADATYTVTGTDANGCENIAISSVTVNALPTITVNNGAICSGQSFTMSPSGAVTYTYSNGSNAAMPAADATYTVTGTDANGCENMATSSVTVNTLPAVAVNNGTICSGQTFTMMPTGAVTYTYSNGSNAAMPAADATYTVTGTDANGCENMATSSVTVNALPVLIATTSNTLMCTGETATLSVSGASSYTWSTNETTSSIVVTPTSQATYTVDGSDANGCSNTTTITQDVSLCTGIDKSSAATSLLNIYPNPNNGLFTIELNTTSQLIVTNALGQGIISETLETGKHSLDIRNQSTGIYFVKVIQNNKQQIIKLIKE